MNVDEYVPFFTVKESQGKLKRKRKKKTDGQGNESGIPVRLCESEKLSQCETSVESNVARKRNYMILARLCAIRLLLHKSVRTMVGPRCVVDFFSVLLVYFQTKREMMTFSF